MSRQARDHTGHDMQLSNVEHLPIVSVRRLIFLVEYNLHGLLRFGAANFSLKLMQCGVFQPLDKHVLSAPSCADRMLSMHQVRHRWSFYVHAVHARTHAEECLTEHQVQIDMSN